LVKLWTPYGAFKVTVGVEKVRLQKALKAGIYLGRFRQGKYLELLGKLLVSYDELIDLLDEFWVWSNYLADFGYFLPLAEHVYHLVLELTVSFENRFHCHFSIESVLV